MYSISVNDYVENSSGYAVKRAIKVFFAFQFLFSVRRKKLVV